MRQITCIAFLLLVFHSVKAQSNRPSAESPGGYFNSFQKFVHTTPNVDSAIFYIRKLASNEAYSGWLHSLLHDSFAQAFIPGEEDKDTASARRQKAHVLLSTAILERIMTDTSHRLTQAAKPVYIWYKVQQYQHDAKQLAPLLQEFIDKELPDALYTDKAARYGSMICELVEQHPSLKPAVTKIRSVIYDYLSRNQIVLTDSTKRDDLERRAWYRYMYAYVNFIAATKASEPAAKEKFLKLAYDYSPDTEDRNNYSSYFYDMIFIFGNERGGFKDEYLTFLTNSGKDPQTILNMLRQMALIDPVYKAKLKEYFNQHNKTAASFAAYWSDAINATAKEAPPIALAMLDKQAFSSKKLLGKWVLVDFWGTWCAPCRAEHPAMQKFYDSTVLQKPAAISLLTIACRDTEKRVTDYMSEKKFSFPVAMSDGKIQTTYAVQGYPTKLLITPKGKYISIPYGVDWSNFIKQYADL
jgi:thiol-disulfide isomerase/thioredoxin